MLDTNSLESYELFLKIKRLPRYQFKGRTAIVPDEYAGLLGNTAIKLPSLDYEPISGLFDYQEAVSRLAIRKKKFAGFIRCGLGKTLILWEYARHVQRVLGPTRRVLIVSPLMVIKQTMKERRQFYPTSGPEVTQIRAKDLGNWINSVGSEIGITNYEALGELIPQGRLGALILDESSYLKSAYGKWGGECIRLGRGLEYKLSLTGTPAPNDRIEFANQAVFMDAFPTTNSFLAKFFVNRGQTNERWELKPHALRPFYRTLSDWSIFLSDPAIYGWKDNSQGFPPVHVHIDHVEMTEQQQALACGETGTLFPNEIGGIKSRSVLSQIAKGNHRGTAVDTLKPRFIRNLVDSWPDEQTIIWCLYNEEQRLMEKTFPDAVSLKGTSSGEQREKGIEAFQRGECRTIISKPKVMGLGLNLQMASRMVFSGLQDSWEAFHQCIARANRVGSTRPLNVHVPVTDIERPMVDTVLAKAHRIDQDTIEQELLFKECGLGLTL